MPSNCHEAEETWRRAENAWHRGGGETSATDEHAVFGGTPPFAPPGRRAAFAGMKPLRLAFEFEVREGERELQLLCELRATQGQIWFALDSLRLLQVEQGSLVEPG
jgi:hypothetical protein